MASGCNIVSIGREYPELIMQGGIDKRVLAVGKDAIDRHLDYILPAMRKRGDTYPPTITAYLKRSALRITCTIEKGAWNTQNRLRKGGRR